MDQLKTQVNSDFKTLASDILKNDRDQLKVDNSDLLTPLQTQLKSFRERIETITKEQVEERTTLKEQINLYMKQTLIPSSLLKILQMLLLTTTNYKVTGVKKY